MGLFDDCKTNKEIIKRMFDLNNSGKYSRQEVNLEASIRRRELESKTVNSLVHSKIDIPTKDTISKLGYSDCIKVVPSIGKNEFIFNKDGSFFINL